MAGSSFQSLYAAALLMLPEIARAFNESKARPGSEECPPDSYRPRPAEWPPWEWETEMLTRSRAER
jgi:hypothetical protein